MEMQVGFHPREDKVAENPMQIICETKIADTTKISLTQRLIKLAQGRLDFLQYGVSSQAFEQASEFLKVEGLCPCEKNILFNE